MPVSVEGFGEQGWALPFLQGVTGAWKEGWRCLLMDGRATAIPSTLSICPTTPRGSSWRAFFLDLTAGTGIGQKGGPPRGITGQPSLLALPGIWSWDPKEGRGREVGLTAASHKRELHKVDTQQVATIIVISAHLMCKDGSASGPQGCADKPKDTDLPP